MNNKVNLVECPRDAMQGWKKFIPTNQKIEYINSLLKVGFDTIDFGSFVSPKAIPQMADTKNVVPHLHLENSSSKLLAIVANLRGAEEASSYDEITYIGYPFSISETFQQRNTNNTLEESLKIVELINNTCNKKNKQAVIYISMAFGNPYGDNYATDLVLHWVDKISELNIPVISLADTVGLAEPSQITSLLNLLIPAYPNVSIGLHLHSSLANWRIKVDAGLKAGCMRFDGALKGIGGCPMADDVLIGNLDSELLIRYFSELDLLNRIDIEALKKSLMLADRIFV